MSGVGSSEQGSLWAALVPPLPPAPHLGPVIAVRGPRADVSRRLAYIFLALVAAGAALLAANVRPPLFLVGLAAAFTLWAFLTTRRTVIAVGQGWWLLRGEAWGRGHWSTFADLTDVRLRGGSSSSSYLVFRSSTTRGRFRTGMSGAVAHALATQVLASRAVIDDRARPVLLDWAGDRHGADLLTSAARRDRDTKRRVGDWQYALSGFTLVLGAWLCLAQGWGDLHVRFDPGAVRVVATVDHTNKQCGRVSCTWWSYGHYQVGGHQESEVAVANDRSAPAKDPQTILVDPAHPRGVVNVQESPAGFLALGLGALAGAALFLALWVRPMLRRSTKRIAVPQPDKGQPTRDRTAAP